jgi:hypothetical protein
VNGRGLFQAPCPSPLFYIGYEYKEQDDGKTRRNWALRAVLSYSRKGYSEAVMRQARKRTKWRDVQLA